MMNKQIAYLGMACLGLAMLGGCAEPPTVKTLDIEPRDARSVTPRVSRWPKVHEQLLEEIKQQEKVDMVFFGDSITYCWKTPPGQVIWKAFYADRNVLNLGVGGEMTEQVIWRMQNGHADGYKAKLAVLMIGTNNSRRDTGVEIAAGVREILVEWFTHQPQSKMLVLGIFPRGETPADPRRQTCIQANELIAKLHDGRRVFYMDIGEKYLDDEGVLSRKIMPDLLHPESEIGYRIWAEAIEPFVEETLGE